MLSTILTVKTKLQENPGSILLVDGIGACASAMGLFALALLYNYVGLPQDTLFILAVIALGFAVYSLSCFYFIPGRWKLCLLIIAILNTLYSMVTLSLVIRHYTNLSVFGLTYFLSELIILFPLVAFEVRTLLKS